MRAAVRGSSTARAHRAAGRCERWFTTGGGPNVWAANHGVETTLAAIQPRSFEGKVRPRIPHGVAGNLPLAGPERNPEPSGRESVRRGVPRRPEV